MSQSTVAEKAAAAASHGVVDYSDVEAVNDPAHRQFYKARVSIYPKLVSGFYRRLKWIVLAATLGIYYLLPWVRWERGPLESDQAILVDFPGRRFYFFFIEIWPDELYFVTGLLIIAALSLFLATALFGRIWCGYSCPQTVWTDLFIAVERLVEGDRNQRMKLAKAPWSAGKVGKKALKHALWLLVGAATGGAWIFYFHDAPTIFPQLFAGDAPFTAYFFLGLLTLTTYLFAGSLREQVCTYMCPWPRIQSALTDADTLQVTYKTDRGEPRGPHKKSEPWDGRGDCIDCKACIAACPMGIDIRKGAQLECINCALCIDACDEIMEKVGRPLRLIGYDTDMNIDRRAAKLAPKTDLLRPRTIFYAFVLVVIGGVMMYAYATRAMLELNVIRDRTPPFVKLSDGTIRNGYTIKVVNRTNMDKTLVIDVESDHEIEWRAQSQGEIDGAPVLAAKGDTVSSMRLFVTSDGKMSTAATFSLTLTATDPMSGESAQSVTTFLKDHLR